MCMNSSCIGTQSIGTHVSIRAIGTQLHSTANVKSNKLRIYAEIFRQDYFI